MFIISGNFVIFTRIENEVTLLVKGLWVCDCQTNERECCGVGHACEVSLK